MLITKDATHIAVTVKGDKGAALRAGHQRGIPLRFVRETPHGECVLIADMSFRKEIARWVSTTAPDVPEGTPLMFTETYVAPYKTRD